MTTLVSFLPTGEVAMTVVLDGDCQVSYPAFNPVGNTTISLTKNTYSPIQNHAQLITACLPILQVVNPTLAQILQSTSAVVGNVAITSI